jgi:hypothetical protein
LLRLLQLAVSGKIVSPLSESSESASLLRLKPWRATDNFKKVTRSFALLVGLQAEAVAFLTRLGLGDKDVVCDLRDQLRWEHEFYVTLNPIPTSEIDEAGIEGNREDQLRVALRAAFPYTPLGTVKVDQKTNKNRVVFPDLAKIISDEEYKNNTMYTLSFKAVNHPCILDGQGRVLSQAWVEIFFIKTMKSSDNAKICQCKSCQLDEYLRSCHQFRHGRASSRCQECITNESLSRPLPKTKFWLFDLANFAEVKRFFMTDGTEDEESSSPAPAPSSATTTDRKETKDAKESKHNTSQQQGLDGGDESLFLIPKHVSTIRFVLSLFNGFQWLREDCSDVGMEAKALQGLLRSHIPQTVKDEQLLVLLTRILALETGNTDMYMWLARNDPRYSSVNNLFPAREDVATSSSMDETKSESKKSSSTSSSASSDAKDSSQQILGEVVMLCRMAKHNPCALHADCMPQALKAKDKEDDLNTIRAIYYVAARLPQFISFNLEPALKKVFQFQSRKYSVKTLLSVILSDPQSVRDVVERLGSPPITLFLTMKTLDLAAAETQSIIESTIKRLGFGVRTIRAVNMLFAFCKGDFGALLALTPESSRDIVSYLYILARGEHLGDGYKYLIDNLLEVARKNLTALQPSESASSERVKYNNILLTAITCLAKRQLPEFLSIDNLKAMAKKQGEAVQEKAESTGNELKEKLQERILEELNTRVYGIVEKIKKLVAMARSLQGKPKGEVLQELLVAFFSYVLPKNVADAILSDIAQIIPLLLDGNAMGAATVLSRLLCSLVELKFGTLDENIRNIIQQALPVLCSLMNGQLSLTNVFKQKASEATQAIKDNPTKMANQALTFLLNNILDIHDEKLEGQVMLRVQAVFSLINADFTKPESFEFLVLFCPNEFSKQLVLGFIKLLSVGLKANNVKESNILTNLMDAILKSRKVIVEVIIEKLASTKLKEPLRLISDCIFLVEDLVENRDNITMQTIRRVVINLLATYLLNSAMLKNKEAVKSEIKVAAEKLEKLPLPTAEQLASLLSGDLEQGLFSVVPWFLSKLSKEIPADWTKCKPLFDLINIRNKDLQSAFEMYLKLLLTSEDRKGLVKEIFTVVLRLCNLDSRLESLVKMLINTLGNPMDRVRKVLKWVEEKERGIPLPQDVKQVIDEKYNSVAQTVTIEAAHLSDLLALLDVLVTSSRNSNSKAFNACLYKKLTELLTDMDPVKSKTLVDSQLASNPSLTWFELANGLLNLNVKSWKLAFRTLLAQNRSETSVALAVYTALSSGDSGIVALKKVVASQLAAAMPDGQEKKEFVDSTTEALLRTANSLLTGPTSQIEKETHDFFHILLGRQSSASCSITFQCLLRTPALDVWCVWGLLCSRLISDASLLTSQDDGGVRMLLSLCVAQFASAEQARILNVSNIPQSRIYDFADLLNSILCIRSAINVRSCIRLLGVLYGQSSSIELVTSLFQKDLRVLLEYVGKLLPPIWKSFLKMLSAAEQRLSREMRHAFFELIQHAGVLHPSFAKLFAILQQLRGSNLDDVVLGFQSILQVLMLHGVHPVLSDLMLEKMSETEAKSLIALSKVNEKKEQKDQKQGQPETKVDANKPQQAEPVVKYAPGEINWNFIVRAIFAANSWTQEESVISDVIAQLGNLEQYIKRPSYPLNTFAFSRKIMAKSNLYSLAEKFSPVEAKDYLHNYKLLESQELLLRVIPHPSAPPTELAPFVRTVLSEGQLLVSEIASETQKITDANIRTIAELDSKLASINLLPGTQSLLKAAITQAQKLKSTTGDFDKALFYDNIHCVIKQLRDVDVFLETFSNTGIILFVPFALLELTSFSPVVFLCFRVYPYSNLPDHRPERCWLCQDWPCVRL